MSERFERTEMLFGEEAVSKLQNSRVAVFGIGGVGGHCAEALVRSGIGAIDLIDNDTVSVSNINRQIVALDSTVGRYKVDVAKERFLDISPSTVINTYKTFYLPETSSLFNFGNYDYVVDAIDTVSGKIQLIMQAEEASVPIISCMGTGNKMDPTMLEIEDIYKTSVCPLARVMRNELKKRGVRRLKVLYSKEPPLIPHFQPRSSSDVRRSTPASNSFVPACAGLIIASHVIKELIK